MFKKTALVDKGLYTSLNSNNYNLNFANKLDSSNDIFIYVRTSYYIALTIFDRGIG